MSEGAGAQGRIPARLPAAPMSTSSDLSFGLVDGRPVFMDMDTDSYFRLGPGTEAEFLGLAENKQASAAPGSRLRDMLGLAPGRSVRQARCGRPAASLLDDSCTCRPALRDVAKAGLAVHSARRSLAREPIGRILARIGSADERASADETASAPDPEQQVRLARRFLAARRLIPVRTNCLLDSIAIVEWLGAHAAGASLVFAVKLDPFAAHCWVQSDRLLLNDALDTVAAFVPVRVIRCSAPGS